METSNLDSLYTYYLAVGLCTSSLLPLEEVSLMATRQGTSIRMGIISLTVLYFIYLLIVDQLCLILP